MTPLFLLLSLALAQDTPEQAFRKIEAAIEAARTIKVEFTIDAKVPDARPGKGTMSIGEGGTLRVDARLESEKQSLSLMVESDGKRVKSTFESKTLEFDVDPKYLRSNHNVYLSRLGIFIGIAFEHGIRTGNARTLKQNGEPIVFDLKQMFLVQDVRAAGESSDGARILTYGFKSAFEPMPVSDVKIWYDPGSYKLLRREYRIRSRAIDAVLIENYDVASLPCRRRLPSRTPSSRISSSAPS
jgi:hypothetical protein